MWFLARLVVSMIAILLISRLVPTLIYVETGFVAFVGAFVLALINTLVRPVLIVLTLPLTIMTFGVFLLVINGLMLWLVAALVPGFHVNGFTGAVVGSVLISLATWLLSSILRSTPERQHPRLPPR